MQLPAPFFDPDELIVDSWLQICRQIGGGASSRVLESTRALLCDARALSTQLAVNHYSCVITSPPYPNRMSYIRELRPYMFWLSYLSDARAAGELDWQAIGGTWGCATSNLTKWNPDREKAVPYDDMDRILRGISLKSGLLARYVHKYFEDMVDHVQDLYGVVRPGGVVNYVVGNSKFYDVLLPVELIFAQLFESAGFRNVDVSVIRKRSSKKELFEYIVSARKSA